MNNKTLLIKIIIPVIILALVGGIWIVKSKQDKQTEFSDMQNTPAANIPEQLKDADFSLNITSAVDFEELAKFQIPAIIDYGSDSCIPCKQMAPALKKLNSELQGKAFIKFADVWKYQEAASNVPVQVIPTQVLVNSDGSPFVPSETLAAEIQFDMYSHRETNEHIFTVHQGGLTEEQMRKILEEMGVE